MSIPVVYVFLFTYIVCIPMNIEYFIDFGNFIKYYYVLRPYI